ncbi:hypothetical protein RPP25_12515, partial [Staphylococcus aureus]|nr:hypothetical protein [Staphylococcus aureus]
MGDVLNSKDINKIEVTLKQI